MAFTKAQREFIPSGGINDVIKEWHAKQPAREQDCASPSTLTECPRVVWLQKHKVAHANPMGWGVKQRLMLGRITENLIAEQLRDIGLLLWHWKDDVAGESIKFEMGEGMSKIAGTPDLLIKLDDRVVISDSKTSRADSFAYVPIDASIWEDELWYHYKLQVEAYYMLCYKNKDWFEANKLELPTACHLFSYALDDGIVKREFAWNPSQKVASEIMHYANRWNKAYASETMPDCQCTETQTKFCKFAHSFTTTKTGYRLGESCCSDTLINQIKEVQK